MTRARELRPIGSLVILSLALLLLTGCPKSGQLIIQDHEAAAWMTTNNQFATDWDDDEKLWQGVLIQLGAYKNADIYIGVSFEGDTEVFFPRDDIEWVNIVSERPGLPEPMRQQDLAYLLPGEELPQGSEFVCKVVDECTAQGEACTNAELKAIPDGCLRLKSLHHGFTPVAVITYWQGKEGFKLKAIQEAGANGSHNRYTFDLLDDFKVEAFGPDGTALELPENIKTITVKGNPAVGHEEGHDPPWPGRKEN